MFEEKYHVTLSEEEQCILINVMNDYRNDIMGNCAALSIHIIALKGDFVMEEKSIILDLFNEGISFTERNGYVDD